MNFEEYKTIINTYLDTYPDDRIDICTTNRLQAALDEEAVGKEISKEILDKIEISSSLTITIYYPKITLKNELNKQHTIYDVYLRILFPTGVIKLGRTTYTKEEIDVGYVHSHVRAGVFDYLQDFCTGGNETPINKILRKIVRGDYNDFETLIQSFIVETERMIRVESLTGGPFIRFSNVGNQLDNMPLTLKVTNLRYIPHDCIIDFIDYYCSLGLDNFYYDGRCWQLDATDTEFVTRVTNAAKSFKGTKNKKSLFQTYYLSSGLYYAKSINRISNFVEGNPTSWSWKGKKLHLKEIKEDNKEVVVENTLLKKEYLDIVYTFLLTLINGVYADRKFKDSIKERAYKIKSLLFKKLRSQNQDSL